MTAIKPVSFRDMPFYDFSNFVSKYLDLENPTEIEIQNPGMGCFPGTL